MTSGAKSGVCFSVAETVLWNAPTTQEHQSDLTLRALVWNVSDASSNFSHTLIVYIKLETGSACNTDALRIVLSASWPAQALNVIITGAALRADNSIKGAAVINDTQSIGIKSVASGTSCAFPGGSVKIGTLIRHAILIRELVLWFTLLTPVVQVIKWQAIDHVAQVGELVEKVAGYALDARVVLVGKRAVLELTGFVGGQFESSLAVEACAHISWAVGCAVFRNAWTWD